MKICEGVDAEALGFEGFRVLEGIRGRGSVSAAELEDVIASALP